MKDKCSRIRKGGRKGNRKREHRARHGDKQNRELKEFPFKPISKKLICLLLSIRSLCIACSLLFPLSGFYYNTLTGVVQILDVFSVITGCAQQYLQKNVNENTQNETNARMRTLSLGDRDLPL